MNFIFSRGGNKFDDSMMIQTAEVTSHDYMCMSA